MDKYKNIWQVENKKNESYIKIELDISGVDGSENGMAKINLYRSGYTDSDTSGRPFRTFDVKTDFINKENRHSEHIIEFYKHFRSIIPHPRWKLIHSCMYRLHLRHRPLSREPVQVLWVVRQEHR